MYKMIIVDDEPLIRSGLASLIEWEEYGIEIIGEAEDGMKAYLLIKAAKPDLALVDIAMPNVNGIELLKMCQKLETPPKFIILSGYSDFEYVRQSMQMGAINYLLKPVDPDELKNTAMTAVGLLDDILAHKQQFNESLQALRNDTLNRLLTNRIETRELREKCRMVNLSFHCSHMRAALIRPLFDNKDVSLRWIIFSCMEICESVFADKTACYVLADISDNIAVIIKDENNLAGDNFYGSLLDKCSSQILSQLDLPTLSVLGPEAHNLHELPDSYQFCLRSLEKKLILREFLGQEEAGPLQEFSMTASDLTRFSECIGSGDLNGIQDLLQEYFAAVLIQNYPSHPDIIKYQLIELVICAIQAAGPLILSGENACRFKREAYQAISMTSSFPELEEKMIHLFRSFLRQTGEKEEHYSPMVLNAVSYIHGQYQDYNLSLKTLASQLNVNAAYLGRQFKQETGEFFSDYLNRVRISQAIHLLDTTSLKSLKIAEMVGFTNTSYFFTIFKKVTGKRPGDYRQ